MKIVQAWPLALLLCACGGGDSTSAIVLPGDPAPVELCVSSACGERTVLLDLPSAENLLFSDDGRLFVSATGGVYEITRDAAGAFSAAKITADGCTGGLGLAIVREHLYAVCSGGLLYGGALTAAPMLTELFAMEGMCIANGMVDGPDGNLYVVDEPLQLCEPDPKVIRLTISPADPLQINGQETWVQGSPLGQLHLGLDNVLRFPNGIQRKGNRFFGTDGGSIYAVDFLPDGSAGDVEPLIFIPTAHDDLGIAGDDLLVADFFGGKIELISQDGVLLQQTDPGTFTFPSSVRLGRPPMFAPGDIVVTETGVLGDNSLPLDHLSVFRRSAAQ